MSILHYITCTICDILLHLTEMRAGPIISLDIKVDYALMQSSCALIKLFVSLLYASNDTLCRNGLVSACAGSLVYRLNKALANSQSGWYKVARLVSDPHTLVANLYSATERGRYFVLCRKRTCRLDVGGHCATENAVSVADSWHYLNSPLSPGRRRRQ